ncbi:uncharacterized protein BP01DRAFT_360463 [Aspergillus saccharolyticus JOP 1030-1]|uniref:Uncharacterized protein n=1 Tax=Aspergillus saccharolyticus JOP 1030-1 TaxID=1450539 RepID=A0A318Z230_9EURO|nr:hypothetical protein BP01DRAFT_360463 [Aspergillus saccharolyticus JOP 1030-1]PYH41345.1 hypothetical protein BP01DRAFT_360463 [Aspergillus saccharolyticus JOP 1030-1]
MACQGSGLRRCLAGAHSSALEKKQPTYTYLRTTAFSSGTNNRDDDGAHATSKHKALMHPLRPADRDPKRQTARHVLLPSHLSTRCPAWGSADEPAASQETTWTSIAAQELARCLLPSGVPWADHRLGQTSWWILPLSLLGNGAAANPVRATGGRHAATASRSDITLAGGEQGRQRRQFSLPLRDGW